MVFVTAFMVPRASGLTPYLSISSHPGSWLLFLFGFGNSQLQEREAFPHQPTSTGPCWEGGPLVFHLRKEDQTNSLALHLFNTPK